MVTDRYSRYTIAIPTYKTLTGEAAAHLFHEHVILTHGRGLPVSIFSDRDPRFVSAFFTEFFTLCGVKLSTTSGYRSTSNGLVEIHNQHLEQLLRGNAFEPEKWLEKLPLAVYNLNATRNLTLGVSPIEAERGYQPRQPLDLLPDIIKDMKLHPDLSARFEALQRLQCEIRESIDLHNEKMKQKHDKRRRPFGTLKAGDLVWLNSQDVSVPAKQFLKTRKLTPRYFGPYKVLRYDAPSTVKLEWRNSTSKVWPFFHVSRLQAYSPRPDLVSRTEPPEPTEPTYTVQRLLAHRGGTEDQPAEYLVQWKGYHFEDCTWENLQNLKGAPRMILQYHERLRKLAAHDPSLRQEYGHEVLAVRNERSATTSDGDLIRLIVHQYEGQMQRLINQGRRWPRMVNPTERPRQKAHTTTPNLDVGTTSQKSRKG